MSKTEHREPVAVDRRQARVTARESTPPEEKRLDLLRDTRGLTTVEYIIVLCLIAVVGFAVWKSFGETVKTKVNGAESVVDVLPTTSG